MKAIKKRTVSFVERKMHVNTLALPDTLRVNSIFSEVYPIVKSLYDDGYDIFMTGMSEGFDLFVSEVILKLKEEHSEIMLIAIIPYMGQELGYSEDDKRRYKNIFNLADDIIFTSDSYCETTLDLINRHLLRIVKTL